MKIFLKNFPRAPKVLRGVLTGSLAYWGSEWHFSILLLGILLLFPAVEDGKTGYISDDWSLLIAISGMITSWQMGHGWESVLSALIIWALYGLLWLIRKDAAGMGDVLLSGAIVLWLTPIFALLFLWLASMLALVWAGWICLYERNTKRRGVRFAPFLALGGGIAYGLQEWVGLSLFTPLWLFAH